MTPRRPTDKAMGGSRVDLTHMRHDSCPTGVVLELTREPMSNRLSYRVRCGCGVTLTVRSTSFKLVE